MSRLTSRGWTTEDADAYMQRCSQVHAVQWRAHCYRGEERIAEYIPVTGGRLVLDSSDPLRRRLTLEIAGGEEWAPVDENSPLVPFGQRITLWVRIDRAEGGWFDWLKMGEYHIISSTFERPSLLTTVECTDMAGAVDEFLFLGKRAFAGQTLHEAIKTMTEEAVPGYIFGIDSSDAARDPDRTIKNYVADAGQGRWDAATELAARRGHECFFNANGGLVIRRDVTDDDNESIPANGPDIGTVSNPVAVVKDGPRGNLLGVTATLSRQGAANAVRINLHSTVPRRVRKASDRAAGAAATACGPGSPASSTASWADAPIRAAVTVKQETGPVAWDSGLFGKVPIVIERDLKDLKGWSSGGEETWSHAQADAYRDAKRLLHRRRGVIRHLDIHSLPLYWVEPDDKVRVRWHNEDGELTSGAHYIQRIELDLGGGPMVLRTRSLNVVDPG
jgi:hypothetical protein